MCGNIAANNVCTGKSFSIIVKSFLNTQRRPQATVKCGDLGKVDKWLEMSEQTPADVLGGSQCEIGTTKANN